MRQCAYVASLIVTLTLASAWTHPLEQGSQRDESMGNKITLRIGDKAFAATLSDSFTAAAFKKLLPLSITMTELNGNEKFARLPATMPTHASRPPSIQAGDVMLYGSSTLVLFYKSFTTTFSYTKIGQVDDAAGLETALGSGNRDVTFEARSGRQQ